MITAKVDGHTVAAGNRQADEDVWESAIIDCHSVGTIIHMAIDGEYAGHIVISDIVKPHSKEAIAALKKSGVRKNGYADRRRQMCGGAGRCQSLV